MLVLATDWGFADLRSYTISELSLYQDRPVPRILLARRARVSEWLLEPYVALATQLAPLSNHAASLLGTDSVLAIARAREKVLERRLSLLNVNKPSKLFGKPTFWHPYCWGTLCEAWRRTLTEERFHRPGFSPLWSMMRALAGTKGTGKYLLCPHCDSEARIGQWLALYRDEAGVEAFFQYCLGKSVEQWARLSHFEYASSGRY